MSHVTYSCQPLPHLLIDIMPFSNFFSPSAPQRENHRAKWLTHRSCLCKVRKHQSCCNRQAPNLQCVQSNQVLCLTDHYSLRVSDECRLCSTQNSGTHSPFILWLWPLDSQKPWFSDSSPLWFADGEGKLGHTWEAFIGQIWKWYICFG